MNPTFPWMRRATTVGLTALVALAACGRPSMLLTGGSQGGAAGAGGTTSGSSGSGETSTSSPAANSATSGAASSSGTGSSGPPYGPYMVAAGGYVTDCDWEGYAWTSTSGTGSTLSPGTFSGLTPGQPLCIQGSVAATTDYSGTAILGINLDQTRTSSTANGVAPTGTGIVYNITNSGQSPLRLQIQAADAATNANDRWCAVLSGSSGTIPWASFTTTCWSTTAPGTPYSPATPIVAVLVLVPGGNTAAVPYNFCINDLGESGVCGVGSTSSGSASSGASSSSSGGGNCAQVGSKCDKSTDCCTGNCCGDGVCHTAACPACIADGQNCLANYQCCGSGHQSFCANAGDGQLTVCQPDGDGVPSCANASYYCSNIVSSNAGVLVFACGTPFEYWSSYFQCMCDGPCLDACASNYCALPHVAGSEVLPGAMSSACAACSTNETTGCGTQLQECESETNL